MAWYSVPVVQTVFSWRRFFARTILFLICPTMQTHPAFGFAAGTGSNLLATERFVYSQKLECKLCSESTRVDEIVTLALGTLFGVSFGFAALRLRTRQLHFGLGLCCRCSNIFARDHEPFLRCCHSNVDPTQLAQHLLCYCKAICTCSAGAMYMLWFQLFFFTTCFCLHDCNIGKYI